MTWIKTAYFKSQFESTSEYTLSLRLQYAVVIVDGLRRSLNIQSPLEKPLEVLCVCVNSSLNLPALLLLLCVSSITVRFSLLFLEFLPLI